jgi:glycerol kinase
MEAESGIHLHTLRVDGGAVKNDFLMQFQSDLLGVPVERPVVNETTALGAAYLAGLAVGFWESDKEIARQWSMERSFSPSMAGSEAQLLYEGWGKAVRAAMAFK